MAINIKELRLGNIIHYDDDITDYPDYEDEEDVVIGCISEYELKGYAYTCYHEINCQRCYHVNKPSLFSPIPLTEEWLVKFGFKKTNSEYLTEAWEHLEFTIRKKDNGYVGTESEYDIQSKPFFHVHQLQNLFHALTGEELTIQS